MIARWARSRRRDEAGYVAVLVAVMAPVLFLALAATALDTARWYVEIERVQKAADAGALGGVPYMPQDLASARTTAKQITARNGYDDAASSVAVNVQPGARPSQLRVTVSSTIGNQFGRMIGLPQITITRSAVADYTGPAPMGSPCNTFGNEPPPATGAGSPTPASSVLPPVTAGGFANCSTEPKFWAVVEGPQTGKVQGDRYQTLRCENTGVDGCSAANLNEEYAEHGYFFVVKVQPAAVGQPVKLQLYDPAFVNTGVTCTSNTLPAQADIPDDMNQYVKDGKSRYAKDAPATTRARFCTGDMFPGSGFSGTNPMTTSFVLREQTDTQDPMKASPVGGCTKQFGAYTTVPGRNQLQSTRSGYDDELAKVFHNWVDLCTFTPTRSGDYYIQVRTNVSAAGSNDPAPGTPLIWSGSSAAAAATGNTNTGAGSNAFAIRAATPAGLGTSVAVSGWDRMPIFVNANSAVAEFNLIRVLPAAKGQFIDFNYFDAADAVNTGAGTFTVVRPTDATGSITATPFPAGCRAAGPVNSAALVNCSVTVTNATHNGRNQTMSIPIPPDYDCNEASPGGCWFRVRLDYNGLQVTDVTTWDAEIVGNPVRLIE